MLAEGALRADQVWKRFRADRNRSLLRDEVARLRSRGTESDRGWAWAVQDVSFDVSPGESIAPYDGTEGETACALPTAQTAIPIPARIPASLLTLNICSPEFISIGI